MDSDLQTTTSYVKIKITHHNSMNAMSFVSFI